MMSSIHRWIFWALAALAAPAWSLAAESAAAATDGAQALRRPALPEIEEGESSHPVDRWLQAYFAEHEVSSETVISDRLFMRRVSLDLIGLLPTPAQLAAFEADPAGDKRARLVWQLLDRPQAYAEHWLTFWNDLLRNAYRGTGFIDGGRQQITGWLYQALHENKPYDQFVQELITSAPGAEGFAKGLIWRGVVNASQRPEMQAAQNLSQVFLATNLKCASCHDSLVNHWKLRDAYALASVFAAEPLELHHCDKPTGETARAGFIYPELGTIDADAARDERVRQLAAVMTQPDNGRLARTIVNRLWAVLLGRGLVEPLDDLDAEPWHRDLLDWLAADLVDHGWDLQHTLARICTSRAYQLRAVDASLDAHQTTEYVFRGPLARRLSAEQFCDALSVLTGVWQSPTPAMLQMDDRRQGGQWSAIRERAPLAVEPFPGRWIWSQPGAAQKVAPARIAWRKTFSLDAAPTSALAVVAADQRFVLYVNGVEVLRGVDSRHALSIDLAPWLRVGENVLAVSAASGGQIEPGLQSVAKPKSPVQLVFQRGPTRPAGLMLAASIVQGDKELATVHTDATWRWSKTPDAGWELAGSDISEWKPAVELGDADAEPWRLGRELRIARHAGRGTIGPEQVRAALCDDDPLIRALGRPNRAQVVTRREGVASTLQALELAAGPLLDERLRQGAQQWLARRWQQPDDLLRQIYLTALGRQPTPQELAAGRELLSAEPTPDEVQDLLWATVMLPEFQLIY